MPNRWIIGLSSGCNAPGVDAALLEIEGVGLDLRVRLLHALHQSYPRDLRDLIERVCSGAPVGLKLIGLVHRLLGETFASAARQVADHASFSLQKVHCISCPEHTVWHDPEGRFPATVGLGMATVVAERTGITTINEFRSRDVAGGGQGVPWTALADYLLFHHPEENRVLIHLGGLATVTFVPAGAKPAQVIGFEAGPCNGLLDGLMHQLTGGREAFDAGGKHAVQGCCIEPLLERWRTHPYLQRRPPKSLPRHRFGEEFIAQELQQARQMRWSLHDVLCTATHFVAHGVTSAVERFLPEASPARVLLSGGGVRNGFLWHLIEQQLQGWVLSKTDAVGVPGDARKAMGAGILAALLLDGVPANIPGATGAAGARLLGSLTPGSGANWARCTAWMANPTRFAGSTKD
jgi:anhydro-N-acetylmuramic acid kinase